MPRIQEYMPEEGASGPQGALQPNIELMSSAGRGVEKLGAGIEAGSEVVYQRQTQMENSDAISSVSMARAEQTAKVQEQIDAGHFDTDTFKTDFADWQQKESDKYETPGGKATFQKQSTRLLGALINKGVKGQRDIAQRNAMSGAQSTIDNLATTVRNDPDQFEDCIGTVLEQSKTLQDDGLLPASHAAKFEDEAMASLTKEHILGTADNKSATEALELMKDPNLAGFLKPQDQDTLRRTLETLENAELRDGTRKDNLDKKASKAAAEKYMSSNIEKITNGSMTAKEILLKMPPEVSFSDRVAAVKQMQSMGEATQRTSPAAMHDIMDRMVLPKSDPRAISDPTQLLKDGVNVAPQDIKKLHDWYLKTPQGEEEKSSEKMMMNDLKGKLKVPNMPDQAYDNRVINAASDFQKTKAKMIKNGEDWTELMDPKSKNYFPNQVRPANPVDIMKAQADAMRDGVKNADIVYASPGMSSEIAKPSAGEMRRTVTKEGPNKGKTAVFDKNQKFLRYE